MVWNNRNNNGKNLNYFYKHKNSLQSHVHYCLQPADHKILGRKSVTKFNQEKVKKNILADLSQGDEK